MDRLLAQLASWKPFRALVVGDFMLDEMLYGDAERLSADAPVPILHVRKREQRPGGAANVCMDLAALRAHVEAFGVAGDDASADDLRDSLMREGVDSRAIVGDASRPTTVKQNLIGLAQARHPQKMFRVDFESSEPLPARVRADLLARFDTSLPSCDVVCIEDYNKGVCCDEVCRHVISHAKKAGKPVFVDPARLHDYSKYHGATTITPNRTEAETATGMRTHADASPEHNARVAKSLLDQLDLETVVLTLDRHGALLMGRDHQPVTVSTIARQVYDVTGAGDMFLAALAAARANAIDWPDSVRFANAAAGLEVEVFGVQPIALERVHHSLILQSRTSHGKLRTLEEAQLEAVAARKEGKRVVFTNGCFDVLHSGHVSLLDQAARFGDLLLVGLNDDASVRRLKGPTRPVNSQEDRARVLGALESVSGVVLFSDDTPYRLIEAIRPDVLVKGADYSKDQVVGGDLVQSYGGRVELVQLVPGKSTTATLAKALKT